MISFRGIINQAHGGHPDTRCTACERRLEDGDPYVVYTDYEDGAVVPKAWYHPGCDPNA